MGALLGRFRVCGAYGRSPTLSAGCACGRMWAGFHWVLVGVGGGRHCCRRSLHNCLRALVGALGGRLWVVAGVLHGCLRALVGACGRQCCAVAGARSGPYGRLHYWGSNLLFMGVEHVYLTLSGLAKKCNQSCRLQLTCPGTHQGVRIQREGFKLPPECLQGRHSTTPSGPTAEKGCATP